MINRTAQAYLKSVQLRFPIVTVIGPRQSGKTTLVRASFPEKPYANLENPADFQFAREDPLGFIYQYPDGCIIDEIQRVPELLSVLQVVSDEKQINGLFIITGSQQFILMEKITQSLAGRTFILKLLPLSIEELGSANQLCDLNQTLLQGFYPRMYAEETIPSELMQSYFETYVQQDVRQVLNIKDIAIFQKFVGLCAGRIGQLLNKESLASDIGINIKTVEEWIGVLKKYVRFYERLSDDRKKDFQRDVLVFIREVLFAGVGGHSRWFRTRVGGKGEKRGLAAVWRAG